MGLTRHPPLLSVVIVNYNGAQYVEQCVDAVCADGFPSKEVYIVDNCSTDRSGIILDSIEQSHPSVQILRSPINLGYAGGINLGAQLSQAPYIAVLNMDTVVTPGWLEPLVTCLEDRPEVGAASPLITLFHGQTINAAGQDIHLTGLGFNRWLGRERSQVSPLPFEVSGIHGGAFIIRKGILDKTGGLDQDGFLYHEDVNISWLMRIMGYTCFCVPNSVVHHDYRLSMYPEKLYLLERNRWAMLLAYLEWPTLVLLLPALAVTEAFMFGYCLLRGPRFLQAKIRSFGWVIRQRERILTRRRTARILRAVSDFKVLRAMRPGYNLGQFITLARERRDGQRLPSGGFPREAIGD